MKKAFVICAALPFLFAGSIGRPQRADTPKTSMDTTMIKRIAARMAFKWARERAKEIDSMFADTTTVIGRVDEEHRPDGSIYAWIWQYRITGRDTIYDTTIIKKVR